MSSVQIVHQVQLFGQAVLFGCCMLLVYDLIRIFRRVAAHGVVWIAVEDMFFWVISAFVLFQFLYQEDDGKVRGFVILAMFLGMLPKHLIPAVYVTCRFILNHFNTAIINKCLDWVVFIFIFINLFSHFFRLCELIVFMQV